MSTTHVFHQEHALMSAAVTPSDIVLIFDTSAGTVLRSTVANLQQSSQASGTTTSTTGVVTLNTQSGVVTTEGITGLVQTALYTLTITNSFVTTGSLAFASIVNKAQAGGEAFISTVTTGGGVLTVQVGNSITTSSITGVLKIAFMTFAA